MYRLFLNQPISNITGTTTKVSKAIGDMKTQYDFTYSYYKRISSYINSDHILITIMLRLTEYLVFEKNIYKVVLNDIPKLCLDYGITSIYTPGVIRQNTFYTSNCIFFNCSFQDNIKPIRCLSHPLKDTYYALPTFNKDDAVVNGISVIGIDLPLLAKVYYEWTILPNQKDGGSIMDFLSREIIPDMMIEQADISLINRLPEIVREPFNIVKYKDMLHRHTVIDLSSEMFPLLHDLIKVNNTSKLSLVDAFNLVPLYSGKTYYQRIPTYIGELNPNIHWAIFITFVQLIYPSINSLNMTTGTRVKVILSRSYEYLKATGSIDNMPDDVRNDIVNKKYAEIYKSF